MMALDVMYTQGRNPRVLDPIALNVWPPAPPIPVLSALRCGQLDDEYRRVSTIEVHDRNDEVLRQMICQLAEVHGEIRVAFLVNRHDLSIVAVWA